MFTSRNKSQGFTLIEVTLAMAVLVLVAGSVYGVLRGTIEVAAALEDSRQEQQQIDGLFDLCRTTFRSLPVEAIVEGKFRRQGGKTFSELLIRRAPELLAWDRVTDFKAVSILALRPQIGGLYSLSLLRVTEPQDPQADPSARSKDADWLKLVTDVSKVEWLYYNANSNLWLEELPPGGLRPNAIKLKLWLAGNKEPLTAVFSVVSIVKETLAPDSVPSETKP